MLIRSRRVLLAALVVCGSARGQATISDQYRTFAFAKKSLRADIVSTITHQSPWGPIVVEEHGTLLVGTKSRFRIDDEFGLAYIIVPRLRTWLDPEHHVASQILNNREEGFVRGEPDWQGYKKSKPKEQVDGWKVTIYRHAKPLVSPRPDGPGAENVKGHWVENGSESVREYWVADELNVPLITRITWPGTELVRRLSNIRLEEPGADVFQIPDGYRLQTVVEGSYPNGWNGDVQVRTTVTGSGIVERTTVDERIPRRE